jgi:hypothetical protein
MRKYAFLTEMVVCVIIYILITIDARDSNKKEFVPHDMDYNSCHYVFLLNSLPLGLIKLETYLSILGKKPIFDLQKPMGRGKYQICGFYTLLLSTWGIIIT